MFRRLIHKEYFVNPNRFGLRSKTKPLAAMPAVFNLSKNSGVSQMEIIYFLKVSVNF